MTATKDVTLWCDHPDCQLWTFGGGDNHTVALARNGARAEGWVYRDGKDFCPRHASEAS